MSKLRADFRVAMLGAASGLFSISLFLVVARVDSYYTYLEEMSPDRYVNHVENLWWLPVAFWHVLLSTVASLMAHRYLSTHRRSPFMLWQMIGLFVLLGWVLSLSTAVGLEILSLGNTNSVEYLLRRVEFGFIAKYVSVVFACHAMYGSAIQAASREYPGEEFPKSREGPVVIMNHRSFKKRLKVTPASTSEKQMEELKTEVGSSNNFDRILLPRS
ncbi:MAG TPA: hypothetical protein VF074_00545 [Pyrinomonadaceae bacterium]